MIAMATENQRESVPLNPALIEWAEYWYPISWKGVLAGGIITAIGACATIAFLLLQWRTTTIREEQSELRTVSLESQTAQANAALGAAQADIFKANARIATANEGAAKANERAAEASRKAEAERVERLKLELRLAPRWLSPQASQQLTALMKPLAGMEIDLITYEAASTDVTPLAMQLVQALSDAGMVAKAFTPMGAGAVVTGILVRCDANAPPDIKDAVGKVAVALNAVGLAAGPWEPFPASEPPAGAYNGPGQATAKLRMLIGAKP
jgi:hypothetical protein